MSAAAGSGYRVERLFDSWGTLLVGDGTTRLPDVSGDDVQAALEAEGIVILRRFEADTDTFCALSERLSSGPVAYRDQDRTPTRDGDYTIQSVNGGCEPLGLHIEGGHAPAELPRVLWFHCREAPSGPDGGTLVCDGRRVWSALGEGAREALLAKRVGYVITIPASETRLGKNPETLKRFLEASPVVTGVELHATHLLVNVVREAVIRSEDGATAFANSLLFGWQAGPGGSDFSFPTYEDGTPYPQPVIDEVIDVTERLSMEVAWEAGDVAMIDNWRTLHGRRRLKSDRREISIRLARSLAVGERG